MRNFPESITVDDIIEFGNFEGVVVRRLDDAVAVSFVGAAGEEERILTFEELLRIKDETAVTVRSQGNRDLEVEALLWKAVCGEFLELEAAGRASRMDDDSVWKVVPRLHDVVLAEVRRLREEYGKTRKVVPQGVTPHELRERLSEHEYRPRLVAIQGGKARGTL